MTATGFSNMELVAKLPALHAFSRSFARSRQDAEDLVQETVVRALANKHRFRRGTRLKSWLFTIMRHTFCNEFNRAKRERPGVDECVSDRRVMPAPQESVVRLKEVRAAMSSLAPDARNALTASFGVV